MKMLLFLHQLHHTKETGKTGFVQLETHKMLAKNIILKNRNAHQ
jgi:hypothetical protein